MPRYFLHLKDHADLLIDPEGAEMPAESVPRATLAAARDCMAADVRVGRLDLRYRIYVHDEQDKLVHALAFADAVEILSPG